MERAASQVDIFLGLALHPLWAARHAEKNVENEKR